ncbi:hypothetical protein PUMCH_004640 [Australozyma saopauloensis]|uniref:Glycerol uptake protein 1 n=1 Tax=Australozyma saopauloensis TaxID=291208 RepID=A0AAX4HG81_9ASCO|nr:hypothetical protein PUMCH_004640 [[Candida] saopauloensis]
MNLLSSIGQFFALETLDARLCPARDPARHKAIVAKAHPVVRWNTWEFKFYMVVFIVVVPMMFKTAMNALNETNANYSKFLLLLSDGWMFGRKVDNSDIQYLFLRDNFWLIWGLLVGHTVLRRVVSALGMKKRTTFDLMFGLVFFFALHGVNTIRIMLHVVVMYYLARRLKNGSHARLALWTYGVFTLFFNEKFKLVPFHVAFLDEGAFKGIVLRWEVFYNISLLRILSYNLDYLEKREQAPAKPVKVPDNLDDRERLVAPFPLAQYNFENYMAYLLYAPLFIAGPIITFNDYLYQSNYFQSPTTKDLKRIVTYGARLLFCVLVMEFILHFMYVVAVSKTKAWDGDTPFELSMLGLFNLNVIWLKLLIPWRLFRLWSLIDGIDPPENMIRCMDNNYSVVGFWRAWHRSYNRWVIRYIYVPLGGGSSGWLTRIGNSLVVFSFVAVWHDIELKLLMWGWLIVLFLLPEILATIAFHKYLSQPWARYVCSIGAVANIWMMLIANLYGFCLGEEGTLALFAAITGSWEGLCYLFLYSMTLFVGTQVMFELRECEKRRGVDVKC